MVTPPRKGKDKTMQEETTKAVTLEEAVERLRELAATTVTPPDSEKPQPLKIQIEICGSWI